MPMSIGQIEDYVRNTDTSQISGGMKNEDALQLADDQTRLKKLLDLISDFHVKMRQINEEVNDGVSHLGTVISLSRMFK